jgi:LysM repeat protein
LAWISLAAWVVALAAVAAAIYIGWQVYRPEDTQPAAPELVEIVQTTGGTNVPLPALPAVPLERSLKRQVDMHTTIPQRPKQEVRQYTVDVGDSVFGIAGVYKVEPETVLWANYDQLNDNPDYLEPGMNLNIPPVDGVYYKWQEGDSLEEIANQFEASLQDILSWPGNQLDVIDPVVEPDTWVMIPGGQREFRQWIVPTIPRGAAGVSKATYGPGACDGPFEGVYGSGAFIYPTYNHTLSGNDYWSGHLGIDLAAATGDNVVAADSGVVVFSGWATGGYGYMVMIDHGNGYQTVYAHLNQTLARCGQSVGRGGAIGLAGSTGNSTGVHLHFEIRYLGGFISPWFVLPAP